MWDTCLLIGAILWMLSLLFLVFSASVALLTFSFSYLFIAIAFFAAASGVMVVCGAMK